MDWNVIGVGVSLLLALAWIRRDCGPTCTARSVRSALTCGR